MTDPALGFWLRHVTVEGGVHEPSGDATYVVLPPALSERYRLPEELRVTADPDVARDAGVTLLALGHPVLSDAAERTLAMGDTGTLPLAAPASAPPGPDSLLAAARDAFPVDHGRIDPSGEVTAIRHPVIRVGALVTYELSAEDRFQEQAERWVDVPSRRLLPDGIVTRLARAAEDTTATGTMADRPAVLLPAITAAHRLIDLAALDRREALAGQANAAHQAERARALAYYADAIAGIERRLATAPADRKAVLAERLRGTREEQARRLTEITEKYAASHVIRPYRLHLIEVPALRLAVDVRRGDRRYPMTLDWLLPAGAFAPVRCPSCGGGAPLVAGKQKLGCQTCLPPPARPAPEPPAPKVPATTAAPAKTARPAAGNAPHQPVSQVPAAPGGAAPRAAAPPARRPAVPPRARQREKREPPERIAEELWTAVARGLTGDAGRLLDPGSPAAVLLRVFGAPGLTQVIGMDPGVPPDRYTAGEYQSGAITGLIAGVLIGTDGSQHHYVLSQRGGLVAEVLPCPVYADGTLWKLFWAGGRGDETWSAGRLPRGASLDLVGRTLLAAGPSWDGLAVAARAVAAWERIPAVHPRVLDGRRPPLVAAAVHRLVAYRAGGRATFAEAAAVYGVPEAALRQADRAIRPLLALGPGQPW